MIGDVDYAAHGLGYAQQRRTDPRIAAAVHRALGSAKTIVNVGAGAGSYEPVDRLVTAVEPSAAMRAQRETPAIAAAAEALPFADNTFDAAMATMTVHQWRDAARGLRELRRVSRGPVVVLTADPDRIEQLWVSEYVSSLLALERQRFPAIDTITSALGDTCTVTTIAVPFDCVDGFIHAFYGRPEELLDPAVRAAQSAWTFVSEAEIDEGLSRLRADLDTGVWDERFGTLRRQRDYDDGTLCLIVSS
jgi:SAM-dependent methyltransferase